MNLLSASIFTEYTLTFDDYISLTKVFSVFIFIIFFLSKSIVSSTKQLAWVLSLVNAFVMTVVSIIYLAVKVGDVIPKVSNLESIADVFHAKNDYCSIICLWFGLVCIYDLILGILFYPKYVQLLTGYVHHSVYLWIMYFSITGNGGIMTSRPFSPCFVFAGIEEIPTFLLALGSVNSDYRTDQGFGITFFFLRILFHIFLLGYSYYSGCDTATTVIYSMALVLHLNWFFTWVQKYSRPAKSDKKKS
jgi:hypothetical protein